ncbi:hypothetical protein CXF32_10265, partial [Corynebacterium bovis]
MVTRGSHRHCAPGCGGRGRSTRSRTSGRRRPRGTGWSHRTTRRGPRASAAGSRICADPVTGPGTRGTPGTCPTAGSRRRTRARLRRAHRTRPPGRT